MKAGHNNETQPPAWRGAKSVEQTLEPLEVNHSVSPGLLLCLLLHLEHASTDEADLAVAVPVYSFAAVGIAYVKLSAAAALKSVAKKVPDTALGSALVNYTPGSLKLSVLLIICDIDIHFTPDRANERDLQLIGFWNMFGDKL